MTPENIRVEYSLECTINIGNFQNVKPGYKVSADVPEGVKTSEVRDQMKAMVDRWMEEEVAELRREAGV